MTENLGVGGRIGTPGGGDPITNAEPGTVPTRPSRSRDDGLTQGINPPNHGETTASNSEAEGWAEHAYLRSCTSCSHAACHSYSVLEALLMCMFYIWVDDYGPGWEGAIDVDI